MLLMIDNYDSFTYNLVQYFGELGQDVRVHRNDQITLEQIDALKPDPAPAPALKTRSLRNLNVEQTGEAPATPSAPKFVSLTIGFKFDSAQITPESASTLSTLAQALNSNELSQLTFMIEGHTDGKGTADYNLRLSQQRAAAVQSFLIQAGVDTKRLQSLGKGDTELVNAQDRFAAENRRVKVIALTQ